MPDFYYVNKPYLFICVLFLALFLGGCDDSSTSEPAKQVITLNTDNLYEYAMKVADDYIKYQDELLNAFYQAKKNNDSTAFNDFRNKQWTPSYSHKKQLYSDTYQKNQDFLSSQAAAKLFVLYDQLIYISLDLKHGLQENNQKKLDAAIHDAKMARQKTLDLVIHIATH